MNAPETKSLRCPRCGGLLVAVQQEPTSNVPTPEEARVASATGGGVSYLIHQIIRFEHRGIDNERIHLGARGTKTQTERD